MNFTCTVNCINNFFVNIKFEPHKKYIQINIDIINFKILTKFKKLIIYKY